MFYPKMLQALQSEHFIASTYYLIQEIHFTFGPAQTKLQLLSF